MIIQRTEHNYGQNMDEALTQDRYEIVVSATGKKVCDAQQKPLVFSKQGTLMMLEAMFGTIDKVSLMMRCTLLAV